jgi:hypothetical protein
MSTSRKVKEVSAPPAPPRWKGRDSLELVHRLNERCLKLLQEAAIQSSGVWLALDAAAIQRAARFPFIILDVLFSDESWWRSMPQNPRAGISLWPADMTQRLMGELLVFAWHTARWDRCIARLSLGMAAGVAEAIAAMTPEQLDIISARHSGTLRLRWQEDSDFWARLVDAARSGNEAALDEIHLHAKLLFAGELIARSSFKRIAAQCL